MGTARRIDWIDFLWALAIVFVVFGHCLPQAHYFFLFTSPVKMPLFFAISGFLFKDFVESKVFFKGVLTKLVVPWLFLGMFPIMLLLPLKGVSFGAEYLLNMLTGHVIWFMPCFILAQIIHYLLRKIFNKTSYLILGMIGLSIIGLLLAYIDVANFAMLNRALVVQSFFLVGFLFKKYFQFFSKIKKWHILVGTGLYLLLCMLSEFLFPGKSIDVHLNFYYNIPFCFAIIYLGLFLLFISAQKMNFHVNFMSTIGQNTLVIYIWSGYTFGLFGKILDLAHIGIDNLYCLALLKTTFACIVCCALSLFLNRFCPFLIGKKRK
jgi:fucose 4-O-acetylase-like acetyltransferase